MPTHRGGKVDYLELSPWELEVTDAGIVNTMSFNDVECSESLKEAKFTVPDFAITCPWIDMGAAFSKMHVADTKLNSFFKKGTGPKALEPPEKAYFEEITRAPVKDAKEKYKHSPAAIRAVKSESNSSLDSVGLACTKIDTAERSKRLQDLKAKSSLHLEKQHKKKVIAIKKSKG